MDRSQVRVLGASAVRRHTYTDRPGRAIACCPEVIHSLAFRAVADRGLRVSLIALIGSRKALDVLRSLIASAVPLLLLVSCSDDDPEPILAPSSSPTPTPTPTTESAEPSSTESAEPESPEEFIERWNELNTEMQNTGETEAFLGVSSNSCQPCSRISDAVSGYYDAGGFVETSGWTIRRIRALNPGETKLAGFVVSVMSAPTEYKESSSADLKTLPGGPVEYTFTLTLRRSSWLVSDYIQNAS